MSHDDPAAAPATDWAAAIPVVESALLEVLVRKLFALLFCSLIAAAACGCSADSSNSSQFDSDLATIRSGYQECVNDLGADAPQCKSLADGLHSVAEQIGSAQTTAGRIKAEDDARHSMGY